MAPATEDDVDRSADRARLPVLLTIATIALIPVTTGPVIWWAPGAVIDHNQRVSVSPYDITLFALVVVTVLAALRERSRLPWTRPGAAFAVTVGWFGVASLFHPSWRGVDWFFHLAGAWAIARTMRRADDEDQERVLWAMVILGALQAVLGTIQSLHGWTLGIRPFEYAQGLHTVGGLGAGRGSLTHEYHLTSLLIVCVAAAVVLSVRTGTSRRPFAYGALAFMGVGIPLTFSRAVILALVPILVLGAARRVGVRPAIAALALGLVIGGAIGFDGLQSRAETTTQLDRADSGRRQKIEQAWSLFEEEPIVGVGAGRYVMALREVEGLDSASDQDEEILPAHNFIMHTLAEFGAPGLAALLVTTALFGWWVFRSGRLAWIAAISLAPFHLLDSYPHIFPVGIMISGLWIGVVWIARQSGAPGRVESSARESVEVG